LATQVKKRFNWVFEKSSLALGAALLCPGHSTLQYKHFKIAETVKQAVIEHLYQDALEFETKATLTRIRKDYIRANLMAVLETVNNTTVTSSESLLNWWRNQTDVGIIRPLVEMMLAIPASSSENERAHRGIGLTLGTDRWRMSIEHLQYQYRVRHFFAHGEETQSQAEYREVTRAKVKKILQEYESWKKKQEEEDEAEI